MSLKYAPAADWKSNPMRRWPAEDATMEEWARALSAMLTTRRQSFSSDDDMAAERGAQGAMSQRMNKTRRHRAAKINMRRFWHLHDQGMGAAEMAEALGVSTRTIERAKTTRRPYA